MSVKADEGRKIETCLLFANGQVGVFDTNREQIPELQVSWAELWATHAEDLGFDPVGVVFRDQLGRSWKITLGSNGRFNFAEA